ncbi:MAG: hypothetical protein LBJ21_09520 [Acidobacteriota bacterium]|jgi:predicted O-linked N-acetylglucosamine transferase (SPINDLY family)|nr:hypothetical protein [Acidobacteriota bacterium]
MNRKLLKLLETSKSQMKGGEYTNALQSLESALRRNPEPLLEIEINFHAALCRCELGNFAGAAENLETTLALAGNVAYSEKKHIYDLLRIAYTHKPDYIKLAGICRTLMSTATEEDKTSLMYDLLYACAKSGKWDEMAQAFDEFPGIGLDAGAMRHKVFCFTTIGRYRDAFQAAREYIERFGEDHHICANLMRLCHDSGDGVSGFEYYKKALARCDDPVWRLGIASQLLGADAYHGAISDDEFPDILGDIRRSTEKLQTNTVFNNTPKPFRKIRIGYLSMDLRLHPVGYFLLPVMVSTVISHCHNLCFNLAKPNDEYDPVTAQFKLLAGGWEDVYERPDSHIEQLFLANRVDVAFDMMSHSTGSRIHLYARRIAPVQISWIGFPVTTGVAAMDYIIADKNVDPPGSEKYYTEKLLYMPECFLCYSLNSQPQVEPPAFTRNGYITFACFHTLKKITDKTLRMWRMILEKCENSRLQIMGLPPKGDEGREIFYELLRKSGLQMERVSISPPRGLGGYLAAYNDVDIMLDTHPFSGATTTFDALKMGRPIVTLVGKRHVTRASYSLLKHVGLDDLAAFSEDEYVEKAVALAGDHERLSKINAELPRRIADSPLTNQQAFRENFEKIVRDAWVEYCFKNRAGGYEYSADNPSELLEQVINATVYLERKLDAGDVIDGALAAEYRRVQNAFCEKLRLVTDNTEFVREYVQLIAMMDCEPDEKNLRPVILTAKRHINTFCNA